MPFWQRDKDPRPPAERNLDEEFKTTKSKINKALDELREEVERVRYREAARGRYEQGHA